MQVTRTNYLIDAHKQLASSTGSYRIVTVGMYRGTTLEGKVVVCSFHTLGSPKRGFNTMPQKTQAMT